MGTTNILIDRGDPSAWDFTESSLTTDNTWRDLDLSSIVPAGASWVKLRVLILDGAVNSLLQFRKNGNTDVYGGGRFYTQTANSNFEGQLDIALDSGRVIEYRGSNLTFSAIRIQVVGWYLPLTSNKLTELTEDTAPDNENLLYEVDDPGGTPVERKATVKNINRGLILLETVVEASAVASIDVENWYSSDFDEYQIEVFNLLPATDTDALWMRMSTNGGTSYDSGTNYGTAVFYIRDGSDDNTLGANSGSTRILLSDGLSNTAAHGGVFGRLNLYDPASTTFYKVVNFQLSMIHSASDYLYNMFGTGRYYSTTAVNAFQFLMSTGNITGTVRVYGVRK